MNDDEFRRFILQQGDELYRDMPWRNDTRPYMILVSELMLQQTQVDRVRPKFAAFMDKFPTIETLAQSSLDDVLRHWQGLGYNRRAMYVWRAAQKVTEDFAGKFPRSYEELLSLPGVGPNTAGAICAYAFNMPVVFIETNIRTVYFHHFFEGEERVSDVQLREKLESTLDYSQPRRFYWALMDYGSYLKRSGIRLNAQSASYKKQSPLEGSLRQMRGAIITVLSKHSSLTLAELSATFSGDERFTPALEGLLRDGLIEQMNSRVHLTKSR